MRNRRNLLAELYELGNFQSLTETFTEIAATKMQRVRDSVVKSREYVDGINVIFGDIKTTYEVEIKRISKGNREKSLRKHNGKTAVVFISANTGLYGDIVRRVFYKFVEDVKKSPADAVIVGKSGKKMVTEEGVNLENANYFDYPDDAIDFEALKPIMTLLTQYEKVVVHYGKFESIVNQTPTASDITGGSSTGPQVASNNPAAATSYLIEPTLEEVMTFFENEIITSVFVQTVHESQLAKFASRMLYMDSANQRIKDQIKATEFEKQRLKHQSANKKQLQTLSSVSLWK